MKTALTALALAGMMTAALGHDAYDHFKNPVTGMSCCNKRDCRPGLRRELDWHCIWDHYLFRASAELHSVSVIYRWDKR